jgi:hypothetical protein
VAAAVQFELEPYLAFPIEDLVVDYCTVLQAEGQTDVLAVGMQRAVVQEQLGVLQAAGVNPEGIDIDAAGLTGLWRAAFPALKGLHAVLHIREEGSVLAVAYNKTLAYFRCLSFTAAQVREHPLAVAREVQNSIRAFQAGWRGEEEIGSLTVTGGTWSDEARERFLREFDIPVAYENLLARLKAAHLALGETRAAESEVPPANDDAGPVPVAQPPAGADPSSGDWFEGVSDDRSVSSEPETLSSSVSSSASDGSNCWEAVIGVALGAAGGGYAFNFRKADLEHQDVLRGLIPHVMVTSCLALLLLAGVAWYYHSARNQNLARAEELQTRVEALEKEVEDLRGQGVDVPAELFTDPSLLDVLSEIGAKMPDARVRITELKVERAETSETSSSRGGASASWITIRGEVKDDSMFSKAVDELKQSDLFQVDDPELKLVEGKSTFKLAARRKGVKHER